MANQTTRGSLGGLDRTQKSVMADVKFDAGIHRCQKKKKGCPDDGAAIHDPPGPTVCTHAGCETGRTTGSCLSVVARPNIAITAVQAMSGSDDTRLDGNGSGHRIAHCMAGVCIGGPVARGHGIGDELADLVCFEIRNHRSLHARHALGDVVGQIAHRLCQLGIARHRLGKVAFGGMGNTEHTFSVSVPHINKPAHAIQRVSNLLSQQCHICRCVCCP